MDKDIYIIPGHYYKPGKQGCLVGLKPGQQAREYILTRLVAERCTGQAHVAPQGLKPSEYANYATWHDAISILIHINDEAKGVNPTLRGASCFYEPDNEGSFELAHSIYEALPEDLHGNAKAVIPVSKEDQVRKTWKRNAYNLLEPFRDPAVLVELGFARTDYKYLLDIGNHAIIAQSLIDGAKKFLEAGNAI